MKKLRKLSAVLLGLVMALSLTAPALAVPSEDFSVLNVVYAPKDTPVNSTESNPVVYTAYRIADVVSNEDGVYMYALTEAFQDCGIDVNEIMGGRSITDEAAGSDLQKRLLVSFGEYINQHAEEIKAQAPEGDVKMEETKRTAIGTNSVMTDGVAQFRGLKDGLYLVTSSSAAWISGTRYTPVPFIVNIPFVYDGVVNNYLTARIKFTTYTPLPVVPEITPQPTGGPEPSGEPIPSGEPMPSGEPVPSGEPMPSVEPVPSAEPVPSEIPTPSEEPPEEDDINDPDVPQGGEPDIEIGPDDVPLGNLPEEPDPGIEVPDDTPPLAELPQTGLLWWPVPVMAAGGIVFVAIGLYTKRKANHES